MRGAQQNCPHGCKRALAGMPGKADVADMDNLTHGALGIAAALLAAPAGMRKKAALGGLIAAELPDFDVFFFSRSDPLFSLQIHRHFTHSLVMIPVLAVLGVVL